MPDLDELIIRVESDTTNAKNGLEELEKTLSKISKSVSGGLGLNSVINQLGKLNDAAKNLNTSGAYKLKDFATALQELGKIGNIKLSSNIATQLTNIGAAVDSIDGVNFNNLNKLASGITSLNGIGNVKISSSLANQITAIGTAARNISGIDFTAFGSMASALSSLSSVNNLSISSSLANQITAIGTAARGLVGIDFSPLREMSSALYTLGSVTGLTISSSIGNQLRSITDAVKDMAGVDFTPLETLGDSLRSLENLPKISITSFVNGLKKLDEIDLAKLNTQIKELTEIMKPLADEMQKVAAGFSAFPSRIQKLIKENEKLSSSTEKVTKKFSKFLSLANFAGVYSLMRKVGSTISGFINQSNEYIEDLNLFNASLGEYASEAQKYAETVSELLGIDPGEWMRNQGVFMTLATGFGVANDKAYKMSKNLTQLGYDISSFFNLSTEEAMQKLQSALAGELEPVRRIGYDLSKAALEGIIVNADNYTQTTENLANAMSDESMAAYAVSMGLTKNYSDMTQAEKSQLRYIALMKQVTVVQGDMARTLDSPSNQLRVLRAQLTMCARAIGNIFIPILNKILPVVISVVKAIRVLATEIANFFGFTLPEVDYSGLTSGTTGTSDIDDTSDAISSIADSADDSASSIKEATEEVEEYKNALMGFDEINLLPDPTTASDSSSGSSKGSKGGTSSDELADALSSLDFDLPEYDFLAGLENRVDSVYEKISSVFDKIKTEIKDFIGTVDFTKLKESTSNLSNSFKHLGSVIIDYLGSAWEKILKPLGKWTLEDAAPSLVNALASGFELLATALEKVKPILSELWDDYIGPFCEFIGNAFTGILDTFTNVFTNMTSLIKGDITFQEFVDNVGYSGAAATGVIAGLVAVFAIVNAGTIVTIGAIAALVASVGWLYDNWVEICESIKQVWNGLIEEINGSIDKMKQKDTTILQSIGYVLEMLGFPTDQEIVQWFRDLGYDLPANILEGFAEGASSLDKTLYDLFCKPFGKLWDWIKSFWEVNSPSKKTEELGKNIVEGFSIGHKSKWDEFSDNLHKWWEDLKNWWSGLSLSNLKVSLPHVEVTYTAASSWVQKWFKISQIPHLSVKWYAKGGFPDAGDLFMANERGPELVGSMNGKTTVANQEEIIEGIKRGVLEAMLQVNGQTNKNNSVTLNVNGKQFCRAIYNDFKSVTTEHGISMSRA